MNKPKYVMDKSIYFELDQFLKNIINKDKIITIGILPIMWLIYFLFEVFSGRVNDLYTLILNLSLIFLFAFVGWIIYMCSIKNKIGRAHV